MKKYLALLFVGATLIVLLNLIITNCALGKEWIKKTEWPDPRALMGVTVLDGKVYLIGGVMMPDGAPVPTLEIYDPARDTWEQKADMHTARAGLSACTLDGKIYAIGGLNNAMDAVATVEIYDPARDRWVEGPDMLETRFHLSTSVVDGKIYAVGGQMAQENGAWNFWAMARKGLRTIEEYDPAKRKWAAKAKMPWIRGGHGVAVVKWKIYVINGGDGGFPLLTYEYDPATDTWLEIRPLAPTERVFLTASAMNDRIYAMGGWRFPDAAWQQPLENSKIVDEYDPVQGVWTKKADMLFGRRGLGSAVVNGTIYVFGGVGENDVMCPVVEQYTPEGLYVSDKSKLISTWAEIKIR